MKRTTKQDDQTVAVPKPMDPSIRESSTGSPHINRQRVCYAIETLVAEVHELFPETPVEYSNYSARNVALDVTFDLTVLDTETDRVDLKNLLTLLGDQAYNVDPRVMEVVSGDDTVLVSMRANPRTQDKRDPFGLADAYLALSGDEESSR